MGKFLSCWVLFELEKKKKKKQVKISNNEESQIRGNVKGNELIITKINNFQVRDTIAIESIKATRWSIEVQN